jgi:hypothetical protein
LGPATLKLSRSGTGQALFARQVRVPWRQHTARLNGATTRLDSFDGPMRLFDFFAVAPFS